MDCMRRLGGFWCDSGWQRDGKGWQRHGTVWSDGETGETVHFTEIESASLRAQASAAAAPAMLLKTCEPLSVVAIQKTSIAHSHTTHSCFYQASSVQRNEHLLRMATTIAPLLGAVVMTDVLRRRAWVSCGCAGSSQSQRFFVRDWMHNHRSGTPHAVKDEVAGLI